MKGKHLWIGPALAALAAGCSIVTPEGNGYAAGTALYLGYTRIASDKNDEFREAVERLWAKVNEMEKVEDIVPALADLQKHFDAVNRCDKLTDKEKQLVKSLYVMVVEKVSEAVQSKLSSNGDALEFLIGVRKGVNRMIEIDSAEK